MRKPHADANKADPIIDALEALTGHEWRLRGELYECRCNHTHANNIHEEFAALHIPTSKGVSESRSGRYFVTVKAVDGPLVITAAAKVPQDAHADPFLPKKWRTDGKADKK
jgi:hypothetical protein